MVVHGCQGARSGRDRIHLDRTEWEGEHLLVGNFGV